MLWKRLLVLAPHTDDAELGCGGAMARFLEMGVDLHVAAFSTAEDSRPLGAPPYALKEEFFDATRTLGIAKENVHVYDYPVRKLSYHRQEVLEELVTLKKRVTPDIVFVPSGHDLHQDHQVLHAEGLRAFRDVTLWGYELPWNHISFAAQAFVILTEDHLKKKWMAMKSYKSQIQLEKPYFNYEFIEGLARLRGLQVKSPFAEAFEVLRVRV